MKTRLAKKIMGRIFRFRNIESNYLPYSKPKQTKAVRTLLRHLSKECRMSYMETLPGHKVPLKWRKIKGFLPGEFDSLKAE
jgi:hypothetical protein